MIAAVSNRGLMRFKLYKGALNVAIFIDFMKRLLKDAKQKVFLIVDNLRVHHAKAVQDWLARHKVEIEIFYLPAYAPEHNPDEYLNNDLKQTIKNKPRAKTLSSPLPRRSSNRSRNARTGSSHTFTQSTCATLLDVSSVSLGY